MTEANRFSDFVVYVDESGDHSLTVIDESYPVFVPAFCIFYKAHYISTVVPRLQALKFKHFGHDLVILHERDIRKEKGDFNIFRSREEKDHFLSQLTDIIADSNFVLACCVIDKRKNIGQGEYEDPYHVALSACLESLYDFVAEKDQSGRETHVVVERRGKKEDKELELAFRRVCDGENRFRHDLPFRLRMAPKASNSAGMQLADLVARPIGRHALDPQQPNQAFQVLERKFLCSGGRKQIGKNYEGVGLKHFP